MKEIKIGRKTFEIKPGDYILDNGACLQFCSGDRRQLYYKNYNSFTHILIPPSTVKKIDLTKLRKVVEKGDGITKNSLTRYYF